MNWAKRVLVLVGLTVFSLFPALSVQATPNLTSDYQDKVMFHTPSHMAKWNRSTLKGLDPHILVTFVGLMLIIIPGTFLYKGRKNQPKVTENEANAVNAGIKKQIILKKMRQLEENFSQGAINQADYTKTLTRYQALLKKVEEERG